MNSPASAPTGSDAMRSLALGRLTRRPPRLIEYKGAPQR